MPILTALRFGIGDLPLKESQSHTLDNHLIFSFDLPVSAFSRPIYAAETRRFGCYVEPDGKCAPKPRHIGVNAQRLSNATRVSYVQVNGKRAGDNASPFIVAFPLTDKLVAGC